MICGVPYVRIQRGYGRTGRRSVPSPSSHDTSEFNIWLNTRHQSPTQKRRVAERSENAISKYLHLAKNSSNWLPWYGGRQWRELSNTSITHHRTCRYESSELVRVRPRHYSRFRELPSVTIRLLRPQLHFSVRQYVHPKTGRRKLWSPFDGL